LKFAFEDLQINRIEFVADFRNVRSRAAIKKMGAMEEGVLRYHMILEDGYIRNSVIFSIVKPDWPQVKSILQLRLEKIIV
jgi:RimJ/RimL family protein N-acetyltransferase